MKISMTILGIFLLTTMAVSAQSKKELKATIQKQNTEISDLKLEVSKVKNQNSELLKSVDELESKTKVLETKNSDLNKRLTEAKGDLESVKKKLDDYLNGPQNLLTQAIQKYSEKRYEEALADLNNLVLKYPVSEEATEAKNTISQINKLQSEIKAEEAKKEAEKNLSINKDEFKQRTFYEDKRGDKYHFDLENILDPDLKLNLYFSIPFNSNTAEALRLTIGYKDDDWLFIRKTTFLIDGKQYEVLGDFERDNGGGNVYEWIDKPANGSILTLVKSLMESTSAKVRFTGDQYYSDVSVNQEQIEALKNIYNLYKSKGGK